MKRIALLLFAAVTFFLASCQKDPAITDDGKLPAPLVEVEFVVPANWPAPKYAFQDNALTKEKFALGRKLFYDPILSSTNTVSCGSCHLPSSSFAQIAHPVSHGINDLLGVRNSPGLFNMAWNDRFMWDGGVVHIENQPIAPIQNPVEMGETLPNVIAKLNASPEYRMLFREAFGSETVTSQNMLRAMAQFMTMLVSAGSRYDSVQNNQAYFTTAERAGQQIFQTNCASCHQAPLFTDNSFRNNGLPVDPRYNDSGRAHITREAADMYTFKVPSLRNLRYTSPYMHDGRFNTLDDVLEHYATGIHASATLDAGLRNGIPLSAAERANLLAFLNTLNDERFIRNTLFHENR